jgi:hypothetical protein
MKIWLGKKTEKQLKDLGFVLPNFPKQGKVLYQGEEVGFMSNFNGLMMKECASKASKLLLENAKELNLCIWNPDTDNN